MPQTFDSLDDWLSWQETLHSAQIDLGLGRVRTVFERLELTFHQTKFITVGGTNGKGSTVAFLNSIYLEAGYRVGKYTSPHLVKYNERIQVNCVDCSDSEITHAFELINQARLQTPEISLTYFEFGVLAALVVFSQQKLDVVLLEVGLGGRLDATNLIDADCAVVTSISIYHRDWLGDTREAIGYEKAGIFRANTPAVIGELNSPDSLENHAKAIDAQILKRGDAFSVHQEADHWEWSCQSNLGIKSETLKLPYPRALIAPIQLDNAASALMAVASLHSALPLSDSNKQAGVAKASLPGRIQRFSELPLVILDVAHNEASAEALVKGIRHLYPDHYVHLILGMMKDKEVQATLKVLQQLQPSWYFSSLDTPRALTAERLQSLCVDTHQLGHEDTAQSASSGLCFDSVLEAYEAVKNRLESEIERVEQASKQPALILVTGSFFAVSPILAMTQ